MSNPAEPRPKTAYHRLLIGFNHHMECRNMLAFAAQVARVAEVELAGVFVEDQQLMDLARLPFSSEILASSGMVRNFDASRVESDLRAIALGMHTALRKLAEQAHRQYSFQTVRGHLLHELVAQAGAEDLILLRTADYPWRNAPRQAAPGGPVVLLQSSDTGNGNLLGLAQEIARSLKLQISVLQNYDGPKSLRDLRASLIIAPSTFFDKGRADIDAFVDAAPAPVLIVPAIPAA